jgi:hypothetical protein
MQCAYFSRRCNSNKYPSTFLQGKFFKTINLKSTFFNRKLVTDVPSLPVRQELDVNLGTAFNSWQPFNGGEENPYLKDSQSTESPLLSAKSRREEAGIDRKRQDRETEWLCGANILFALLCAETHLQSCANYFPIRVNVLPCLLLAL